MARSVLDIAKAIGRFTGLGEPETLVTSTDPLAMQIREALRHSARDMLRAHDWPELILEGTWTSAAQEVQVSSIKTSYPKLLRFLPETFYDDTAKRKIFASETPQGWTAANGRTVSIVDYHVRVRGDKILLYGDQPASHSMKFEYLSGHWVENSAGDTTYEEPNADTDIPLLDDHALELGATWRVKRENGLEYAESFRDYQLALRSAMGGAAPPMRLNLNPRRTIGLGSGYVPDGSYPAS